ncbi:MAG TPA: cell division protein SepF, partial [Microbacterium sp.]|nr:cell division protein SepF [Microbacterium sp.]
MSNVLKKSMVYLGLADEEEVYDETESQPARKAQAPEK